MLNVAKSQLTAKEFLGYFGSPMTIKPMEQIAQPEKYLGFRVPVLLAGEIETAAHEEDLTVTQLMRRAIRQYLAARKKTRS